MRGTAVLTTVLALATASVSPAAEPPGSGHVGDVGIDLSFGLGVTFGLK